MVDQRKERGKKTRIAIIEATLLILETSGMHSLSTRAIAKKAGISQSNLYHHFKNVDEILLASFEYYIEGELKLQDVGQYPDLESYLLKVIYLHKNCDQEDKESCSRSYLAFSEKVLFDKNFQIQLSNLHEKFNQYLRDSVKQLVNKDISEEKLEQFIFFFNMFREGVKAHQTYFHDCSIIENIDDKIKQFIKFISSFLRDDPSIT
ncbi:MAG: AcrR family transcriptional regulator [bacterium]|jgi:AcrR family transcriptional regulator